MATSTLDSLNELTSSVKTDMVLVQDDPSGSPEDKKETINNLLATPVDKTMLVLGSEPAGNPPAGFVYRWASSADKKTYIKDSDGTVTLESGGLGAGSNHVLEARITPTTDVPIETSDVASITQLYITPFEGNQVRIYDGSNWQIFSFSEITVKITNTLGCAYSSGSPVITVSSSADLLVGMVAAGTGIPAGAVISTIDSLTQVTLDQNTTSTVPGGSVDFKIPANKVVDLFLYSDSGTVKCKQVMWTNATTRATALTTQDGIKVLTGQTGWLYVGKYCTRATAGQTSWNAQERNIQNHYHKRRFKWFVFLNNSYQENNASFTKWNATDGDSKIYGLFEDKDFVDIRTDAHFVINGAGTTGYLQHGIGIDSESVDSADYKQVGLVSASDKASRHPVSAGYSGTIAEGFHYICGQSKYITNVIDHVYPVLRVTGGFLG